MAVLEGGDLDVDTSCSGGYTTKTSIGRRKHGLFENSLHLIRIVANKVTLFFHVYFMNRWKPLLYL